MTTPANNQPAERMESFAAILRAIPGSDSVAQRNRMLTAMQKLGSVTSFESSRYLDCYHPPARIFELRQDGQRIKTVMQGARTECGAYHRVGVFILEGGGNA